MYRSPGKTPYLFTLQRFFNLFILIIIIFFFFGGGKGGALYKVGLHGSIFSLHGIVGFQLSQETEIMTENIISVEET